MLFLGAIGAAIVVLKPKNSFALFCCIMGVWSHRRVFAEFPYKTPWLLLNFVVPLALIAGYAIQAIYEMDRGQLRGVL